MTTNNFIPFQKDGAPPFSTQVTINHKMTSAVTPTVLTALDKTSNTPGQPFVIGDYGTADGGISYKLVTKCIDEWFGVPSLQIFERMASYKIGMSSSYIGKHQETLAKRYLLRKKYGEALPIQVIYEDQPINNFRPVFMRVHGMLPDVEGLVTRFPGVSVMACGTSFYLQCLPDNSIDFVFSTSAVLCLSKSPDVSSASLFPALETGHAHEVYRKQAEEDWVKFLLHRSKELRPGGCLVVANVSSDTDRRAKTTLYDMYSHMSDVWKTLHNDGIITKEEFERTAVQVYYRSREELVKPFLKPQCPVSNSGLVLESVETQLITCPLREWWITIQREGMSGHAKATQFSETVVAERKARKESSILRGLENHRTADEKRMIFDIFCQRYRDLMSNDPLQHVADLVLDTIVVRKVN